MKRLSVILGAMLLMAFNGGMSQVASGSDLSPVALCPGDAPDGYCADLRTKISQAQAEIDGLRDEINSLWEDVRAGKNREWALQQIERLEARIRSLRADIARWEKDLAKYC